MRITFIGVMAAIVILTASPAMSTENTNLRWFFYARDNIIGGYQAANSMRYGPYADREDCEKERARIEIFKVKLNGVIYDLVMYISPSCSSG